MSRAAGLVFLAVFVLTGCSHQLPDFTSTLSSRLPQEGQTESIGEYSLGCLVGAQTFTGNERGLYLSQKKRGRYWGHPALINLLARAGSEFDAHNKALILGDLSLSRGGPTMTGHHSHQNGLDVDVWFKVLSKNDVMSFEKLETEAMKSISTLGEDQKKMIQFFAGDDSVERIFINPTFKKALCNDQGPLGLAAAHQRKLRAWWGHDDHIHVRIKCPEGSKRCLSQKPIPEGNGCGEELNWWFTEEAKSADKEVSWNELKMVYLDKLKKMPAQCSFYKDL